MYQADDFGIFNELLSQRRAGERVYNRLHDTALRLTAGYLSERFPGRSWLTATGNTAGLDIAGSLGKTLDVACEVKGHDHFRGNRREGVLNDLRRLARSDAQHKFLAVIHQTLADELGRSRSAAPLLQDVEIIVVPDLVQPRERIQIVGLDKDRWMAGLLAAWSDHLSEFERVLEGSDVPWVYREETQVGLFATAATRVGCLALVESEVEGASGERRYLDLWVGGTIDGAYQEVNVEFKIASVNISSGEALRREVVELLNKASAQVRSISGEYGAPHRYAMVVVPLKLSENEYEDEATYSRLIDEASETLLSPHAVGGEFAVIHWAQPRSWKSEGSHRSPAVAVIGKVCN